MEIVKHLKGNSGNSTACMLILFGEGQDTLLGASKVSKSLDLLFMTLLHEEYYMVSPIFQFLVDDVTERCKHQYSSSEKC